MEEQKEQLPKFKCKNCGKEFPITFLDSDRRTRDICFCCYQDKLKKEGRW